MEIAMQMNTKIEKLVPYTKKITKRPMQKAVKITTISCKANKEVAMQEKKTNFYELLSLSTGNVGMEEIKQAYRSMALQYHPDVCPPSAKEESTRRFVELRKAYETLSNPISRKRYDYELGLIDSIELGIGEFYMDDRRLSLFPREVWEIQLSGLKKRSFERMQKKKNVYM